LVLVGRNQAQGRLPDQAFRENSASNRNALSDAFVMLLRRRSSLPNTRTPHFPWYSERPPILSEEEKTPMQAALDVIRESFTLYLVAGMVFSALSVWAAVKAMRSEAADKSGLQRTRSTPGVSARRGPESD
jgi:hypothetical protein